jgi:hypothetical protein
MLLTYEERRTALLSAFRGASTPLIQLQCCLSAPARENRIYRQFWLLHEQLCAIRNELSLQIFKILGRTAHAHCSP